MKKCLAFVLALALVLALAACSGAASSSAPAAGGDDTPASTPAAGGDDTPAATGEVLKVGAITSLSGSLQDYGECFQRGFLLGIEYMTDGTDIVAGRPLEIIWEDTTTVNDVARERTLKLLDQDQVELVVGYAASGDATASIPLFEEYETVAIIEPAAGDAIITEGTWNEYIFRTGRTTAQDALAMVAVLKEMHPEGDATIACFAPDSTYGYGMVDPFVAGAEAAGFTVGEISYAPQDANDFSPYFLSIKDSAPDYLYVSWAGANSPWTQLLELDLQSAGITLITGAPDLPQLRGMIPLGQAGGKGFCVYYPTLPQNDPINDWMVERHMEEYGFAPDFFTPGGFAAAIAMCTALEKTGGVTDAQTLIAAMEGMEFDSPTGKRYFRAEDHQAMQDLYAVDLTWEEGSDHLIPKFVRVIEADEITPPILNGRG